jgi:hypothetical protein
MSIQQENANANDQNRSSDRCRFHVRDFARWV